MNQDKPSLYRAARITKIFVERLVETIMDPNGLDDLNNRILSGMGLTERSKRIATIAWKIVVSPYALVRLFVNFGLLLTPKNAPNMAPLVRATDLFPSPKVRKLLKKMVVEQGVHIAALSGEGRFRTARWIWITSWFLLLWYGLHGLVTSVAKAIRGRAA